MDSGMSGTADIAAEKLLEAEMSADQGSTEQVIELNVSCMRSLCSPFNHSLVFHVTIVLFLQKDTVQHLTQVATHEMIALVHWAKQIPHYVELPLDDQMRLLISCKPRFLPSCTSTS